MAKKKAISVKKPRSAKESVKKPKSKSGTKSKIIKSVKSKKSETPMYEEIFCSFCGKSSNDLSCLFISAQPPFTSYICADCVDTCNKVLLEKSGSDWYHRIFEILAKNIAEKEQYNKVEIM
ncbi:MAG: hypothetical protein LBI28_03130 [Treponema sp.]|jgi:hypothetical protein|nr:hypothetical protein [Treponema sp.]